MQPFLVPYHGERDRQEPRSHSADASIPTITAGGKGQLLTDPVAQPLVVKVAHGDKPGPLLLKQDHSQGSHARHGSERVGGQGDGVRLVSQPLYTLTTKAGQALVIPGVTQLSGRPVDPRRLVLIDGVLHLLDLRFRMRSNRELARAMGFDAAIVAASRSEAGMRRVSEQGA